MIILGCSLWINDGSGQAWAREHAIYGIGGSDLPKAAWSTKNNFPMNTSSNNIQKLALLVITINKDQLEEVDIYLSFIKDHIEES